MTPGKKQTNLLLFKDKQTNKLKKKTIFWDISENGFLRTGERVWISQRRQTFVADRESTLKFKDKRKCDSSTEPMREAMNSFVNELYFIINETDQGFS